MCIECGRGRPKIRGPLILTLTADELVTLIDRAGKVFRVDVAYGSVPAEPRLKNNYPNPFNGSTMIGFSLPKAQRVELSIYNLLGQKVATLVDSELETGFHEVRWNSIDRQGHPLPSGVYFARFLTASTSQTSKLLLIK